MVGYVVCVQDNGTGTGVDLINDLRRFQAPEHEVTFIPLLIGFFSEGVDNSALKPIASERTGKISQTDGHVNDPRCEDVITLNNKIGIN